MRFRVLAVNVDSHGTEFASLMEARNYPFYGSQFHPEKNAFEWSQSWEANNTAQHAEAHDASAIKAMSYLASFFVAEARRSPHRYSGELPLIYDFEPVRTVSTTTQKYEQCYVF